jgi:phytoene desaturase
MAAAIRLAKAGLDVEIWEKNPGPGGKVKELSESGYRWDTGPSLLTMPDVLRELFSDAGASLEEYLTLERLDSTCRYFWSDGTVIDENEAFWRRPEVARFLAYARGIYQLSGEAYLNHPPSQFWRAFSLKNWPKLRHLPKVATTQTMAAKIDSFFSDSHLRQLFYRFATYNGSSPYLTPATFNIIPFVEADFGGWYVRGGMFQIALALEKLAKKLGVTFYYQSQVIEYRNGHVVSKGGAEDSFDAVVCNADVIAAHHSILPFGPAPAAELARPELSCSGLIFFWGVQHRYGQLRHHNIFFSDNYPAEFRDIFSRKELPGQPTIYIAISARMDAGHAPEGCDNYFVLINAPARNPDDPWSKEQLALYRSQVIARLERMGLPGLARHIVCEEIFTPTDFATRDLARHGALYGWASHSIRASLLRPPLRSPHDPRLYFVGGTTHPGGGIPLVLLSGKMVADLVQKDVA